MLVGAPGAGNEDKYERWYPLFEKELGVVAKPDARIISIGDRVGAVPLPEEPIRPRWYHPPLFGPGCTPLGAGKTRPGGRVRRIRCRSLQNPPPHLCTASFRLAGPQTGRDQPVRTSRKRLMFVYKVRFERIRNHDMSGWRHWQGEWQHRLATEE